VLFAYAAALVWVPAPSPIAARSCTAQHQHPPARPPAHLLRAPCRFIKGNIQSADLIVHILEQEQIDTVMHFAAQTHVDNSFGNSMAFTMNNA